MSWAKAMVSFDTETTGPDPLTARIVSAAIVHGRAAEDLNMWCVNPGVPIPAEATAVHGITDADVQAAGYDPVEVLPQIVGDLVTAVAAEKSVVIFNAPFDLTVLQEECRRYSLPTLADHLTDDGLDMCVVDPHALDKYLHPGIRGSGTRTLGATATRWNVEAAPAHAADGDARTAGRIAWAMACSNSRLASMPREAFMGLQARTHRAWAEDLEAYFRSVGRGDVVNREWPVRTPDGDS